MTTVMTTDEEPAESQAHGQLKGVAKILAVGLRRWRDMYVALCPVIEVPPPKAFKKPASLR